MGSIPTESKYGEDNGIHEIVSAHFVRRQFRDNVGVKGSNPFWSTCMTWYSYALSATIFLAAGFLLIRKASTLGVPVTTLTFYIWVFAALMLFVYMGYTKESFSLSPVQLGVLLLTAVSFLFGALLLNYGVYAAPNPGYASAVASAQVLIVIIASIFLFGSPFDLFKALGAALTVAGVILLGT